MIRGKKALDPQTAKKKAQLVNALNSAILSVFGFLFFAIGLQKGIQSQEGIMLLILGILFLILGIVRSRMIGKLMREVDEMDEEIYEELTKEHHDLKDD